MNQTLSLRVLNLKENKCHMKTKPLELQWNAVKDASSKVYIRDSSLEGGRKVWVPVKFTQKPGSIFDYARIKVNQSRQFVLT